MKIFIPQALRDGILHPPWWHRPRRSEAAVIRATVAILCALAAGTAGAAAFPERPIRIIVPTAIGGPSDLCVRSVTDAMYANLGQMLVVENITGATGNIGLERVANAAPDGYTIAQASAANTANLAARPKASFDLAGGLKPIGKVCVAAFSLVVAP